MTATARTPRGVIDPTATSGPRKRRQQVVAEAIRALPLKCGTTVGSLTLALSGRHAPPKARGRPQGLHLPDARPRGRLPGPLERVVRAHGAEDAHALYM